MHMFVFLGTHFNKNKMGQSDGKVLLVLSENAHGERDRISDEDLSETDLPEISLRCSQPTAQNTTILDSIDLTCSSDLEPECDAGSEIITLGQEAINHIEQKSSDQTVGNNCIVLGDDSSRSSSGFVNSEALNENNLSNCLDGDQLQTKSVSEQVLKTSSDVHITQSGNLNTFSSVTPHTASSPEMSAIASSTARRTHDISDSESSDTNDAIVVERKPLCDLLKSNGISIPFRTSCKENTKFSDDDSNSNFSANVMNDNSSSLPEIVANDAIDCDSLSTNSVDVCTESLNYDSVSTNSTDVCTDPLNMDKKTVAKKKKRTAEEIAEQKRQAQLKKEERERERKEKLEQKQKENNFKKVVRESKKQYKPGDCLKFMSIVVDNSIVNNCGLGAVLYKMAADLGIKCVTAEQPIPNMITWKREVTEWNAENTTAVNVEVTEDDIMHVLTATELSELVHAFTEKQNGMMETAGKTLKDHIQYLQSIYSGKILSVVGVGMEKYFRDQKTNTNRKHREAVRHLGESTEPPKAKRQKKAAAQTADISRVNLEEAITDAQLFTGCHFHLLNSADEVASFVKTMTKAVAEKPAKKDRLDSIFSFLEEGTKNVKVDKDGNGLIKVWKSQLLQFKNVGADMADAIVSAYPSPQLLVQAYSKCATDKEKERLLENIVVRRGAGVLETNRRIGKELSRRIYLLFNKKDPDFVIK